MLKKINIGKFALLPESADVVEHRLRVSRLGSDLHRPRLPVWRDPEQCNLVGRCGFDRAEQPPPRQGKLVDYLIRLVNFLSKRIVHLHAYRRNSVRPSLEFRHLRFEKLRLASDLGLIRQDHKCGRDTGGK